MQLVKNKIIWEQENDHKIVVIKNLVDHAILLSDKIFHQVNLRTVFNLLFLNNYTTKFNNEHINKRIQEIHMKRNSKISKVINDWQQLDQNLIISFLLYGDI